MPHAQHTMANHLPLQSHRQQQQQAHAPLKILFLDIDGVLLPFPNQSSQQRLFPDAQLQALSNLLEVTDAELVLSSTWRVRNDFVQDILDCFQQYASRHQNDSGGGGEDVGACGGVGPLERIAKEGFYSITDPAMHTDRQSEIYDWLRGRKQEQQQQQRRRGGCHNNVIWLALDDEELLEGDLNQNYRSTFEGHVVKTISSVGLTMEDVNKGIDLWKLQLDEWKNHLSNNNK
jgi:hypothetical protein